MKNLLAILFSAFFFLPAAKGQSNFSGEIYGVVFGRYTLTEPRDVLAETNVYLYSGDSLVYCIQTNQLGIFSFKPINAGVYNLRFIHQNFPIGRVDSIKVPSGFRREINQELIHKKYWKKSRKN